MCLSTWRCRIPSCARSRLPSWRRCLITQVEKKISGYVLIKEMVPAILFFHHGETFRGKSEMFGNSRKIIIIKGHVGGLYRVILVIVHETNGFVSFLFVSFQTGYKMYLQTFQMVEKQNGGCYMPRDTGIFVFRISFLNLWCWQKLCLCVKACLYSVLLACHMRCSGFLLPLQFEIIHQFSEEWSKLIGPISAL